MIGCPKCGSQNVTVLSDTNSKGFGGVKGCFGYLILGPIGWLCGLCGMGKTKTTIVRVCNNCGYRFR